MDQTTNKQIPDRPALLNAPVLTAFGGYRFSPLNVAAAKELVAKGFESYIGHPSTCEILQRLLDVKVPLHRGQFVQQTGVKAIVFRLLKRPPEGTVLKSVEEIESYGYEFGLLERTE